jgi:hypothetical protein
MPCASEPERSASSIAPATAAPSDCGNPQAQNASVMKERIASGMRRVASATIGTRGLPMGTTGTYVTVQAALYLLYIRLRLENPKIGRIDDAEIVGDRITEGGPVFWYLLAQEMQNRSTEVVVGRVALIVGHVSMHQTP